MTCKGCRYDYQDGDVANHCENVSADKHQYYPQSYNCNGYDKPIVLNAAAIFDIKEDIEPWHTYCDVCKQGPDSSDYHRKKCTKSLITECTGTMYRLDS